MTFIIFFIIFNSLLEVLGGILFSVENKFIGQNSYPKFMGKLLKCNLVCFLLTFHMNPSLKCCHQRLLLFWSWNCFASYILLKTREKERKSYLIAGRAKVDAGCTWRASQIYSWVLLKVNTAALEISYRYYSLIIIHCSH